MITSHVHFERVNNVKVSPIRQFLDTHDIKPKEGARFTIPDHSIVLCKYVESSFMFERKLDKGIVEQSKMSPKKYKYNNTPTNLLEDVNTQRQIQNTIVRLETEQVNQQIVNNAFKELCVIYNEAIEANVPACSRKNVKKRKSKPWWNDELNMLWKEVVNAERQYLNHKKNRRNVTHLKNQFKSKQNQFDRQYSRVKRAFLRKQANDAIVINTSNPKEFWRHIKNIGPTKKQELILQNVSPEETNHVLKYWEDEYKALYNKSNDSITDQNEDITFVQNYLHDIENNMSDTSEDDMLNGTINEIEVKSAVDKAKVNKSVGYDQLPNEVFKNNQSISLLTRFFNVCFQNHLIPEEWTKAIIKPIPKGSSSNPHTPNSYRGISLLCCVYKIYSSVLNSRVVKYLEHNNKIVDEQNGFRKARACIDHLFVLTSVIRTRKLNNKDTFICFIDFKKAFDFLDRGCLL